MMGERHLNWSQLPYYVLAWVKQILPKYILNVGLHEFIFIKHLFGRSSYAKYPLYIYEMIFFQPADHIQTK